MPGQDWRALGMGRPPQVPPRPTKEVTGGFLDRLSSLLGLDQPSLGSRMIDLDRMRQERMAAGGAGPPPPDSPEAQAGFDIGSNFNFTGTFGGLKAKTANMAKYDMAQAFEKGGVSPEAIWQETGWFRGPESRWRFEIDDSKAKVKTDPAAIEAREGATIRPPKGRPIALEEVLSHPELEAAYYPSGGQSFSPNVVYNSNMGKRSYGSYSSDRPGQPGTISINKDIAGTNAPTGDQWSELSTQIHELQHFLQNQEGFPRGGNPEEFMGEHLKFRDTLRSFEDLAEIRHELDLAGQEVNPQNVGTLARQTGFPPDLMLNLDATYPTSDALTAKIAELRQMVEEAEPFNRYQDLAGEVESRASQLRQDYTPEQRRAIFPLKDYERAAGKPLDKLVVRYR